MTRLISEVTFATGQKLGSILAVYYSASDHTVLWRWTGGEDVKLAVHPGSPDQYRQPGRNTFGWPEDDSGVVGWREHGCGCTHRYKHYTPPDPFAAEGTHAWREHAR